MDATPPTSSVELVGRFVCPYRARSILRSWLPSAVQAQR
jgi:hypothetical protein